MWLATKLSARRREQRITEESGPIIPPMKVRQDQLGLEGAIEYRRLYEKHPDVELGPDETLEHHLVRLRSAEKDWQNRPNPDAERRQKAREQGILRPLGPSEPDTDITSWVTEPRSPGLSGLPQRIPGWYTGDAMDVPPPGLGRPPMPQRTPMSTPGPWRSTTHPPQQSHEEWLRGLADKGIFVDQETGRRMTPEQMALPQRSPRGYNIWEEFTRPYGGQHRVAAKETVAYVKNVVSEEDLIAAWLRAHKDFGRVSTWGDEW